MEDIENMTHDDVLEVIKGFPVQPLGRKVLITLNMEDNDGGLILSDNSFDEVQYIVAKGAHVNDFEVGAKVLLDLEQMMEYTTNPENSNERIGRIKIRPIQVGDRVYGLINDRVIDAVDNR